MIRAQRRQIEAYLYFKDRDMSVAALVKFNWRLYLLVIPVAIASVVSLHFLGKDVYAWDVGVAYIAFIVRDLAYYKKSASVWPMLRQVIDWGKLQEQVPNKTGQGA